MQKTYPLVKAELTQQSTHFITEITATYQQLVKALGEPHFGKSEDGKVQAEWRFNLGTKGDVVTVYDYKENQPKEKVTNWHIGGNRTEAGLWAKNIILDLIN